MPEIPFPGERPNQALEKETPFGPIGAQQKHPVEKIQLNARRKNLQLHSQLEKQVYGIAAPMGKHLDRTIVAGHQRLPGLKSSHVGLDSLMNLDTKLEFEDFLNTADTRPTPLLGFNHTVHDVMEKRLGLSD